MKTLFKLSAIVVMSLGLFACGGDKEENTGSQSSQSQQQAQQPAANDQMNAEDKQATQSSGTMNDSSKPANAATNDSQSNEAQDKGTQTQTDQQN